MKKIWNYKIKNKKSKLVLEIIQKMKDNSKKI